MRKYFVIVLSLVCLAAAVPAFAVGENSGSDCSNCGAGTSGSKTK